ncbi:MAG: class I SAM-dependent methyltransferase [Planctomycetes bacterium]|nr:class I SAM-dependent methyltransferase [Planctomycetota bacterium]
MPDATPDFATITQRQQQVWGAGDFNMLAMQTMQAAESLVDAADPRPGQRVLDIACGSGNNALVSARRHCDVVGLDFVPSLVARARQRAAADGVAVEFREGDAQALPFADKHFDVVLSTFGVMFAPNQEKAAQEILRVIKPGGKIGIAAWMPEGFGGEFFKLMSKYAPPPAGLKPASRWGTLLGLVELFGTGVTIASARTRAFRQHYRSVPHGLEVFFSAFGPAVKIAQTADAATVANLKADISAFFTKQNRATDGTLILDSDYFETIARRV